MNSIPKFEKQLQQKQQFINDILHAVDINLQSQLYQVEEEGYNNHNKIIKSITFCVNKLKSILKEKNSSFLQYLIIKLIQKQENCIRRQRLTEYEQKISDQRRIINDKQKFYQLIMRPVKKKPSNMRKQEYKRQMQQQAYQNDRQREQRLNNEIKILMKFKNSIFKKENNFKINYQIENKENNQTRNNKLENTKSSLLEHFSFNELQQKTSIVKDNSNINSQIKKQNIGNNIHNMENDQQLIELYNSIIRIKSKNYKLQQLVQDQKKKKLQYTQNVRSLREQYKKQNQQMQNNNIKKHQNIKKNDQFYSYSQ